MIGINPQFIDQENFNFYLQSSSPCIDTGDPNSPLDPDGTRADIGAYYYHQNENSFLGCLDELACNYNDEANEDDDSCDYSCHNNGAYSLIFDGIDDYVEINNTNSMYSSLSDWSIICLKYLILIGIQSYQMDILVMMLVENISD